MSSIHRRKGRKNWYCSYRDSNGKQYQRCTDTTNRKQAEALCERMERAVQKVGKDLTPLSIHRTIARAVQDVVEALGMETPSAIAKDYFKGWLEDKKDSTAKKTFDKYENVANRFLVFLKAKADQPLSMVTTSDIREYLRKVKDTRAAGTANNHLKVLRALFKRAYEVDKIIIENPAMGIQVFRHEKYERQPFTREQFILAYEHACDDWKAVMSLGLFTGQRLRDICNLKWGQIDLDQNRISFKVSKTSGRVFHKLTSHSMKALNPIHRSGDPTEPVFPELCNRTSGMVSNRFRKILERAGLVEKRTHQKRKQGRSVKRELGLSFHCLRHTTTSWGLRMGVSRPLMQDIVGHESEAINAQYSHFDDDSKLAVLEKIEDYLNDDTKSKVVKLKA